MTSKLNYLNFNILNKTLRVSLSYVKNYVGNLSITKKISSGYSLVFGIAILGGIFSFIFTDNLATKAQKNYTIAQEEIQLLTNLDNSILDLFSYQSLLIISAKDSIQFEYEISKFWIVVSQSKHYATELKVNQNKLAEKTSSDDEAFLSLEQEAINVIDDFTQLIQDCILSVETDDTSKNNESLQEIYFSHFTGEKFKQINYRRERISEQLILLIQTAEMKQDLAEKELQNVYRLRQQLFISTILVSMAFVIYMGRIVSQAISHPIQELTEIARRVTHESEFSLQAPVNSEDEIGSLARSFNQLIIWVREYTDELELAKADLEQRVEERTAELEEANKKLKERTAELEEANKKLKELSELDSLTQLANRRCFDISLNREWQRAIRQGSPLALILVDVDYFKNFNDAHGHPAGDRCLRKLGSAIKASVNRSTDVAARYGGEEFAILLPETNSLGAVEVAKRLKAKVLSLAIIHRASKASHFVTLSVGVSSLVPTPPQDQKDLIEQTDQALYRAKENGRNCIETYVSIA